MNVRCVLGAMAMVCVAVGISSAQVVQMAANCDKARTQLLELIAKPDAVDARKIRQDLGVDIFVTCDSDRGTVVCFQCLDDNQKLRTLQIIQKPDTKRFEFLGFGCRCEQKK